MDLLKANPDGMIESYYNMDFVLNRLRSCTSSVRDAADSLSVTCLSELRNGILSLAEELDGEQKLLEQLMTSVNTACQYYSACENRILNNCYSAAAAYPFMRTESAYQATDRDTLLL